MNRKFFIFVFIVISLFTVSGVTIAEESSSDSPSNSEEIEELEEDIEKYKKKLNELSSRVQSLSNEIEYADTQIALTETQIQNSIYKIQQTENEIEELTDDLADLGVRIDKLVGSIDHQQVVLQERQRTRYKTKEVRDPSTFMIFFGSSTIGELVQKATYLRVVEEQDIKLLEQMRNTKNAYDKQKQLFEEKKTQEEQLHAQLQIEKANLDSYQVQLVQQKADKKRLLEDTQNDEEKYQDLLAEAQRELNQIIGAVSVLKGQDGEKVKKGDVIGIQGNSGYSFGDHLHFGVYRYSSFEEIDGWNWYYNNYVDPDDVLKDKNVYWDDGCRSAGYKSVGDGDWGWPLSSPTVSQGFGHTCYSDSYYGGKVHPAYDMYGAYGAPVYAAEDGEAYFCDNCLGDGGNGVFIFHDDDYMTLYWHLQ